MEKGSAMPLAELNVAQLLQLVSTPGGEIAAQEIVRRGRGAHSELNSCISNGRAAGLSAELLLRIEGCEEVFPAIVTAVFSEQRDKSMRDLLLQLGHRVVSAVLSTPLSPGQKSDEASERVKFVSRIGTAVVAPLVTLLGPGNSASLRVSALTALALMGDDAASASDAVIALFRETSRERFPKLHDFYEDDPKEKAARDARLDLEYAAHNLSACKAGGYRNPRVFGDRSSYMEEKDGLYLAAIAWTLGQFGNSAAAVVPDLASLLHDDCRFLAAHASAAILLIAGPESEHAEDANQTLIRFLNRGRTYYTSDTPLENAALSVVSPMGAAFVPIAMRMLRDEIIPFERGKRLALCGLSEIAEHVGGVLPELLRFYATTCDVDNNPMGSVLDGYTRKVRLSTAEFLAAAELACIDSPPEIRHGLAKAVSRFLQHTRKPESAPELLAGLATSKSPIVRRAILKRAGIYIVLVGENVKGYAEAVVNGASQIVPMLDDEDDDVQLAAAAVLKEVAPRAPQIVTNLLRAFTDPAKSLPVRREAGNALLKFKAVPHDNEAIRQMIESVTDDHELLLISLQLAGKCPNAADDLVTAVAARTGHKSNKIRDAATTALLAIAPDRALALLA